MWAVADHLKSEALVESLNVGPMDQMVYLAVDAHLVAISVAGALWARLSLAEQGAVAECSSLDVRSRQLQHGSCDVQVKLPCVDTDTSGRKDDWGNYNLSMS